MRTLYRPRMRTALAFGAALAMAGIIYAEIRSRPTLQYEALPGASRADLTSPPASRAALLEKSRFQEIARRPLFLPTRRPPSEPAVVADTPTLDVSLSGIVISASEPFALIKSDDGAEAVRVKQGEEISGWTVARIEPDRIVVRHYGTERQLLLDFAAPAPVAAMPNEPQSNDTVGASSNQQSADGGNGSPATEAETTPPSETQEPASPNQNSSN